MTQTHLMIVLASCLGFAACGGAAAESSTAHHDGMAMHDGHCGGGMECGHHEGAEPTGPVVAPGEAHVGDTTTCPVSGERFVVTEQSPHSEYEGHTYYFCCPHCIERFEADPAHYAHPADTTAAPQG